MAQAYQLIEPGPLFTPLRYGLLTAAQPVDDPDPHWQQGTVARVDPCGPAAAVTGGPCNVSSITKSPTVSGVGASAAQAFAVYGWVDCATVGWGNQLEDLVALAEQHLTNGEGRAVEHVFWTGQAANGVVYPHLAADTQIFADPMGAQTVELQSAARIVTGGPVSVMEAIGMLEGALAECYGGEGILHLPAAAVAQLSNVGVVRREGEKLRTLLGNVVAAYASGDREGPDGTNPPAGQSWIYATGAVSYRRSPIKRLGARPGDFVGRDTNSTVVVVERSYVLDWTCCHFAVLAEIAGAAT